MFAIGNLEVDRLEVFGEPITIGFRKSKIANVAVP
jgi:hypothetical protein